MTDHISIFKDFLAYVCIGGSILFLALVWAGVVAMIWDTVRKLGNDESDMAS